MSRCSIEKVSMYALGLTYLRTRKSTFIHGAGDDALVLSSHLGAYLGGRR